MNIKTCQPIDNSMDQKRVQPPPAMQHVDISKKRTLNPDVKIGADQNSGNNKSDRIISSADKIDESKLLSMHSCSDRTIGMIQSTMNKRRYQRRNSATAAMLLSSVGSSLREMKRNNDQLTQQDTEPPATKRRFQRRNSATAAMLVAGLMTRNQPPSSFRFDSSSSSSGNADAEHDSRSGGDDNAHTDEFQY